MAFGRCLADSPFSYGMIEYVPALTSRLHLLQYHSSSLTRMCRTGDGPALQLDDEGAPPARTVEIPVCYGGEFGPDLEFVAQYNGLSEEDVIRLHSAPLYRVHMIGFAPGFPYLLSGLSERIATATPDDAEGSHSKWICRNRRRSEQGSTPSRPGRVATDWQESCAAVSAKRLSALFVAGWGQRSVHAHHAGRVSRIGTGQRRTTSW